MNLKTPGREDEGEETKLFTRSDFKAKTGVGPDGSAPAASSDPTSALILKGLGGKANLSDVDCCATRLRVTVLDAAKVSDTLLKQSGASGVIHKGNGVQVIYGPQVAVIKSNLVDFMETPESNSLDGISAAPAPQKAPAPAPAKKRDAVLCAHMSGAVVPMGEVQDEAFATCVLGEGAAIEPSEGRLYAPADAEVDNLFDTHHAIGLVTSEGVEVLLHIGINTVELAGQHFTAHVEAGQKVKKGDLLISFDMEAIKAAGYLCTTPMIVCNTDDYQSVKTLAQGDIKPGAPLVEVKG